VVVARLVMGEVFLVERIEKGIYNICIRMIFFFSFFVSMYNAFCENVLPSKRGLIVKEEKIMISGW